MFIPIANIYIEGISGENIDSFHLTWSFTLRGLINSIHLILFQIIVSVSQKVYPVVLFFWKFYNNSIKHVFEVI